MSIHPGRAAADIAFELKLVKEIGPFIDKHFCTSIVQALRQNEWGSDRQHVIAGCQLCATLKLEREPDNEFDPNAIRVSIEDGDCVGYLKPPIAAQLSQDIDENGRVYVGFVKEVTGGTKDKPFWGLNIAVVRLKEECPRT